MGARIRSRRKALRLSLEALAAALGITHQQLQKYETGGNRISVPMLYEIAGSLECWVGDFYEGLPAPADLTRKDPRTRSQLERLLSSPGGSDLVAAFIALPPHLQQPLVAMARASVSIEPTPDDVEVGDAQ